jgi:hypothetical protein
MIEPNNEFNTAALWGNSLQSASFVAINSNELIGSTLGIILKANSLEHKFTFFDCDHRKELIDRTNPADKLKLPSLPNDLNNPTKTEHEDMQVLALFQKAIPIEFESDPPMTEINDVNPIESLQSIREAAAIIGEAWQFLAEKYSSSSIHKEDIFAWGYVSAAFEEACNDSLHEKLATAFKPISPSSNDDGITLKQFHEATDAATKIFKEKHPDTFQPAFGTPTSHSSNPKKPP